MRMVSTFSVEKLNRITEYSNDNIVNVLVDMGVRVQHIVQGKYLPISNILLATPEDYVTLTKRNIQNQD